MWERQSLLVRWQHVLQRDEEASQRMTVVQCGNSHALERVSE
jgi:hypothetical protein